jgi:hypothetical protein
LRFFTHKEKERILTDFYRIILGTKASTQDLIDLKEVYPNRVDLSSLAQPFSEEEIHKALILIPRDKSPGPGGFGSGFYQDFWAQVKPYIINLFHQFYDELLQLDRNNRSCIVLIKKRRTLVPLTTTGPFHS